MKIITNLRHLHRKFKTPVAGIGIFDGVHLGHKRILQRVKEKAAAMAGTSIVVTFNPHPHRILDFIGAPPLLVSLQHRLNLIAKEGIGAACVLNFNDTLAKYEAQDFVKKILVAKIGVQAVVVGSNFKFGKDKKGDINLLRLTGQKFGFAVEEVPLLKIGSRPVSSTRIRSLIMRGSLEGASRLLGRPVSVLGTVVKGAKRGRLLGYPTANINPHHEAIPPSGVYAVYVICDGKKYRGILNIGTRPTFGETEPTIEVHLFHFNKDIYGKDAEIIFVKKIRDEKKFPGKKELIRQINIDENKANMIL